jgi:hypothetical protein
VDFFSEIEDSTKSMSQLALWHTLVSLKNLFSKVSSVMLMEHFLCDDVGGKHNVCGMAIRLTNINYMSTYYKKIFTENRNPFKNNSFNLYKNERLI